jgi:lia operon protein LiaF
MNTHFFNKMLWGLVLIGIGVLFLLDQTGLIKFDIGSLFSTYWPVFLIYFGFMSFIFQSRHNFGGSIWNLIVCFVGIIFLLNNLHLTSLSLGDLFKLLGPVALILFGISIIFKPSHKRGKREDGNEYTDYFDRRADRESRREAHKADREALRQAKKEWRTARHGRHENYQHHYDEKSNSQHEAPHDLSEEEKEVMKDVHGEFGANQRQEDWDLPQPPKPPVPPRIPRVLREEKDYSHFVNSYQTGGVEHKSNFIGDFHLGQDPWELRPMEISHFIGDTVIDLTRAAIPLGETSITVSSFIGDVKIFIPNDIDVEVRVTSSSFIGDMNVLNRKESGWCRYLTTQTPYYGEAERKLIVTTSMFIGDVVVKKIG